MINEVRERLNAAAELYASLLHNPSMVDDLRALLADHARLQAMHTNHGVGSEEGGPDDPDCSCRGTTHQTECARHGCGFCLAATKGGAAIDLVRVRASVQSLLNWIDDWAETPGESGIEAIAEEAEAVLALIDRSKNSNLSHVGDINVVVSQPTKGEGE